MWAISLSTTVVIVASPTVHRCVAVLIVPPLVPAPRSARPPGGAVPAGSQDLMAQPTDGRGTMPGGVPPLHIGPPTRAVRGRPAARCGRVRRRAGGRPHPCRRAAPGHE